MPTPPLGTICSLASKESATILLLSVEFSAVLSLATVETLLFHFAAREKGSDVPNKYLPLIRTYFNSNTIGRLGKHRHPWARVIDFCVIFLLLAALPLCAVLAAYGGYRPDLLTEILASVTLFVATEFVLRFFFQHGTEVKDVIIGAVVALGSLVFLHFTSLLTVALVAFWVFASFTLWYRICTVQVDHGSNGVDVDWGLVSDIALICVILCLGVVSYSHLPALCAQSTTISGHIDIWCTIATIFVIATVTIVLDFWDLTDRARFLQGRKGNPLFKNHVIVRSIVLLFCGLVAPYLLFLAQFVL